MRMSTRASSDTPIIFISGATGVGTTTLAAHLAPILAAQGILGTDTLRETLRHLSTKHRHLYTTSQRTNLHRSTYNAWINNQRDQQHAQELSLWWIQEFITHHHVTATGTDPKTDARILRAYTLQARTISEAIIGSARRALREGFTLLIEGVHLTLPLVLNERHWHLTSTEHDHLHERLFTIHLDCDPYDHLYRFLNDQKFQNRPDIGQYFDHWYAIQIIREHLTKSNAAAQLTLDGRNTLAHQTDTIARHYYAWKTDRSTPAATDRFDILGATTATTSATTTAVREKFLAYLRLPNRR